MKMITRLLLIVGVGLSLVACSGEGGQPTTAPQAPASTDDSTPDMVVDIEVELAAQGGEPASVRSAEGSAAVPEAESSAEIVTENTTESLAEPLLEEDIEVAAQEPVDEGQEENSPDQALSLPSSQDDVGVAVVADSITICMSQEPDSLYMITSNMAVTAEVNHATHSGGWYGTGSSSYETRALINNEFPSFENGGAFYVGDQLTVIYQFKDTITWSDGHPFNVDDILFTREVIIDPNSGATSRGILDQMVYEKVDDFTLKVTYPSGILDPTYFLPPLISAAGINPSPSGSPPGTDALPEHILGGMTAEEISNSNYTRLPNPVLGPYQYVEWIAGSHITLREVNGWWGGATLTPEIVYRFVPDANQMLALSLSGECDYVTSDGLQLGQLPFIQNSADQGMIAYDITLTNIWEHIDMNVYPPAGAESGAFAFFADQRVREAIVFGTNRLQMIDTALYGEGKPFNGFLPASYWAYNSEVESLYAYDPDAAIALLAEAGWTDGDGDGFVEAGAALLGDYDCGRGSWNIPTDTPFEISYHTTTGNTMREQIAIIFNANMENIGVRINLDLLPASIWFADDGPLNQRTFQIGEFAWGITSDPSSWYLYAGENVYQTPGGDYLVAQTIIDGGVDLGLLSEDDFKFGRPIQAELPTGYSLSAAEMIPSAEDGFAEGGNYSGWCNEAATQALFDGDNVIDSSERLPFFLEAQRIFAEEKPSVPLFQRIGISPHNVDLCGPNTSLGTYASWNIQDWQISDEVCGISDPFAGCDSVEGLSENECDALDALYTATGGTNWTDNSGWLANNAPCSWVGVSCFGEKIRGLSLPDNNLVGTLPSAISDLQSLSVLDLSGNTITGDIPLEVWGLTGLTTLDLGGNAITGSLPAGIGNLTGLTALDLGVNKIAGVIPVELGSLSAVTTLDLSANAFSGEIPATLTGMTSLTAADFGKNALTASDVGLLTFLAGVDADWSDTKTVAPTGVAVEVYSYSRVKITWDPINYTAPNGYYEVSIGTSLGGPYTVVGKTDTLSQNSFIVDDLNLLTDYYVVVRTYTQASGEQQNNLWSDGYSVEATGQTGAPTSPPGNIQVGMVTASLDGGGPYTITLTIEGEYPIGCGGRMTFDQQVDGVSVYIDMVQMERPGGKTCGGSAKPFSLNVILDGAYSGATYTIYINGESIEVVVP